MSENQLSKLTDNALLQNYRATHNKDCIGILFKRYKHLVWAVCVKYLKNDSDTEDTVMEIFEKLHLDLQRTEIENFKGWLHTVTRNHCLGKLRKVGVVLEFPENLSDNISVDRDNFEVEIDTLDWKELLFQKLEIALPTLKPGQLLCLDLFYLKDKSYKQILLETDFSMNEIKSHIQNGKVNLKKVMGIG